MAVLAVMLVVLLFFRDLRNTLVTIAGLPVILICTFGALWAMGQTINIFSLLALSLSVGLVIDDAIVVRENIFRHLEMGEEPMVAASRGTAQVAVSVLAMTLTIIAVFIPVTLANGSGTTGVFFKTFGLTVAAAMAISLVEAFTFAPMLSANLFARRHKADAPAPQHEDLSSTSGQELLEEGAGAELGRMAQMYERLLNWSLRHRLIQVVVTVVILIGSIFVAHGLQISFLPSQASDTFGFSFQLPAGSALNKTNQFAKQAEAVIRADPDVRAVQTNVGSASAPESASFTVRVKDMHTINAVRARLRGKLGFLPQLAFSTQSFRGGSGADVTGRNIQVQIESNRAPDELAAIATQVQQVVQAVPGVTDAGSSLCSGTA